MAAGPTWLELIAANLLQFGTAAARPTATDVANGTYYYATDTAVLSQARSGAWVTMTPGAAPFSPPRCQTHRTSDQVIANTTVTPLQWQTEDYDTDAMLDLVSDNTRVTCKTAGIYLLTASLYWQGNSNGYRMVNFVHSAGQWTGTAGYPAVNGNTTRQNISATYNLAVNDYLTVSVLQTSGGNLNVLGTSVTQASVAATYLAATP